MNVKPRATDKGQCITVVSGLPRSGTSLMMQMLEAGGMAMVTDKARQADEDNPRGYYEDERVKKLKHDATWLDECAGKAVKVISMLLYDLPADRDFKVIFMRRNLVEVLASQKVMLGRRGETDGGISDEELGTKFEKHLRQVEEWLARQPHIQVLYVWYTDVVGDAKTQVRVINQFLGGFLSEERMAKVVELSLYRQRKSKEANGDS